MGKKKFCASCMNPVQHGSVYIIRHYAMEVAKQPAMKKNPLILKQKQDREETNFCGGRIFSRKCLKSRFNYFNKLDVCSIYLYIQKWCFSYALGIFDTIFKQYLYTAKFTNFILVLIFHFIFQTCLQHFKSALC